jgi:hypothetical protein
MTEATHSAGRPDEPGEWQAIHVHYTGDSSPMLTECVAPLVASLRERGLIERYFFINYWLEGPHVRLRLKPVNRGATATVVAEAEAAVRAFLDRLPALWEAESEFLLDLYEDMFRMEYSEEERIRRYGTDGRMPLRENNTYRFIPYEPEYDRYGGTEGVALAEWHFEHSSDLVLGMLGLANVHLRTVRLGLAAQLMMIMASALLDGLDEVAEFLDRYHHYWRNTFQLTALADEARFDVNYADMAEGLCARFAEIHGAVSARRPDRLTNFRRVWAEHCIELRDRVSDHARRAGLVFPVEYGSSVRAPLTDTGAALKILLSPYLHMTNNRLGVTLSDEAYLSYLLNRVLVEQSTTVAGPAA